MKLITEKIKGKVAKYFSTRDEIKFAYLFGSQAKNDAGKLSDIDIGVYLDEKIDEYKRFDIRLELIGEVGSLVTTNKLRSFYLQRGTTEQRERGKIDLVILNDIPLSLSYRVVRDGKIIYCKDELKRIRFEARIMSMYFDQQYYYNRHTKLSLEHIAKEGIL